MRLYKKKNEENSELLDKKFVVRQKKSIFGKTEKICKFCKENQDLQFFKAKKKSEKFLHSYLLCEIKEISSKGELKRKIIFKGDNKNKVTFSYN